LGLSQLRPGLKPQRLPRGARLARALAIRYGALKLIDERGRWGPLRGGPEAKKLVSCCVVKNRDACDGVERLQASKIRHILVQ
jgi:hypothetical protein